MAELLKAFRDVLPRKSGHIDYQLLLFSLGLFYLLKLLQLLYVRPFLFLDRVTKRELIESDREIGQRIVNVFQLVVVCNRNL